MKQIKKYIILTYCLCSYLNAIEISQSLLMEISRTYGYVTAQRLVAEKLKNKYPEIKQDLVKAQLEFDLQFKSSIENMKKSFGDKEWAEYQAIMDTKLIAQINNLNLDMSYKNSFANEILARAKGTIESPVIETLLLYNPTYQKHPSREFADGFKKRLNSKDKHKAKKVDFHIDIPKSWKVKDGKRPNTLWMTTYNNGHLGEQNSSVGFGVLVKELPEEINTISSQEAQDFCNDAFKKSTVKDCTKITLENLPAIYARNTMTIQRLRLKSTMEVANYFVFYKDKVIILQGMVSVLNNQLTQKQLDIKFNKYISLFDQIANSLVINDLYNKTIEKQNNYYIYKLFDNKFQAIFPDKPSLQQIPKELLNPKFLLKRLPYEYTNKLSKKQLDKVVANAILQVKNNQPYIFSDTINQISYTSQTMPSNLEHENYLWSGMKDMIDKQIKDILKADNRTTINFSSKLDKYNDTYIAVYTSNYFQDGEKVYSSTKHIYYKDNIYKWTISYVNQSNKNIFDEYQHNVKVITGDK